MKLQQLPQPVLVRLLDFEERVQTVEHDAHAAEQHLAELRRQLSPGVTDVSAEQVEQARDSLESVFTAAKSKHSNAVAQAALLAATKHWIEGLPFNTKLVLQHPAINGVNLDHTRAELAALREQRRQLQGNPPAGSDIARRVDDWVGNMRRAAQPFTRGFAQGQTLDVRWPAHLMADRRNGDGFLQDAVNPLLLLAALFPAELAELILRSITVAQPLSQLEHAERLSVLDARIEELGYVAAALVEKNGGSFDPQTPPCCVLGVKLETEATEGHAAA